MQATRCRNRSEPIPVRVRQPPHPTSYAMPSGGRFLPGATSPAVRLREQVRRQRLAQLPRRGVRQVLAEFEGYSLKEIAELTGASLSNVKVRIFRAKQKLYNILQPILNDYE